MVRNPADVAGAITGAAEAIGGKTRP